MRIGNRVIVVAAVVVGATHPSQRAAAQAPHPASVDVPVTKVMLFSSGVGYFEHAGVVRGNSAAELRFKTNQINDILKSIMLQDQDGGRVGTITYPSQDPLTKTLKSFQVDITQNPSLADLLNQLRGARVTVQSQAERLTGTILGVEMRRKSAEKNEPSVVPVLNIVSGAMIRSIELDAIASLSLDDPQLQDELTKALAALAQARDQDKKPVTITFTGTGERHVRIAYVVETPVWKTSYRLMLDDKRASGSLQGWAIVENQTETDWNDVSLSLVSGRPISFKMDLYQPLYAARPTVVPELFASLRPQLYEGGTGAERDRVAMPAASAREFSGKSATSSASASRLDMTTSASPFDMTASVTSVAAAANFGALFQYTIGNVTLARQKSAMLPIVTDTVHAERVSIYNAATLRSNPLNGVWLENTTGKHLLQGPVTVLDNGGYAGDARIDNVPPGQKRLLSYGVDLDMTVDNTKGTQTSSIVSAKISQGVLSMARRIVSTTRYAADNTSAKEKTLVIEHPFRRGWKLVDTRTPLETTPTVYRFKGTAAPNKVTTLDVTEELTDTETLMMTAIDVDQLAVVVRNGEIPKAVRDAMANALQLKQAVLDVDRQIAARSQQIAEITAEQNRIRENMKTVAASAPYYSRLLEKLDEQESSIEKLQGERADLTAKRDAARRDLEAYLSSLSIG